MHLLSYEELRKLPVISFYEDSFRKATGVPLLVVAPGSPAQRLGLGESENEFCHLVASSPAGCEACHQAQIRALVGAAQRGHPNQIACFAGLTDVAVPVYSGGRHLATLLSGQVSRRDPTERDFLMIAAMVGRNHDPEWMAATRKAYFATPVVTADRFQAIIQMLEMFASYLEEYANTHAIAQTSADPAPVAKAKDYIRTHIGEPITLDEVVSHVAVSRFYFCKLFKKATGMTLTEHIARIRVEKAKALLADPAARISEAAFEAGFGSIPQFNTVFKRYVGFAPSEYREQLKREQPGQTQSGS